MVMLMKDSIQREKQITLDFQLRRPNGCIANTLV
jgi:hypothetical protein